MAEYRSGNDAAAEKPCSPPRRPARTTTPGDGHSAFYRAMSLFRQGKKDEARKLAIAAAAKMKPLPEDEKNPLAGGADHDDLILWLAYKEAKAMIQFDAFPRRRWRTTRNEAGPGPHSRTRRLPDYPHAAEVRFRQDRGVTRSVPLFLLGRADRLAVRSKISHFRKNSLRDLRTHGTESPATQECVSARR